MLETLRAGTVDMYAVQAVRMDSWEATKVDEIRERSRMRILRVVETVIVKVKKPTGRLLRNFGAGRH
jgi:hypothetical protein